MKRFRVKGLGNFRVKVTGKGGCLQLRTSLYMYTPFQGGVTLQGARQARGLLVSSAGALADKYDRDIEPRGVFLPCLMMMNLERSLEARKGDEGTPA